MKNNYHITKNGRLKRNQNTLLIVDEEDKKHRIPVEQVESIYIHGQIDINTKLADFLNKKGVEIHIFGWNGQYSGSLVPKRGQVSGQTVVKQVEYYKNDTKRQNIAKEFVSAYIDNMVRNLKYYQRNTSNDYKSLISNVEDSKDTLNFASNIDEIMGAEAEARSKYYEVFEKEIDEFDFKNRNYNPPQNEVNAVISYLNSLLYTNVISAIRKTALDPTVSYLHQPGERRYSLSLDIADLFKPIIVTRVSIRLFNRNQLSEDSFESELNKVLLSDEGQEICLKEFEKQMDKTVEHPELNRHISYQYLPQLESYKIKKHLIANEDYNAFRKWW